MTPTLTRDITVTQTAPDVSEDARARAADLAPLVDMRALTKRYGSRTAVDNLTMTVQRGEVFGFLGPNGAGKTTTLRMLLGLIRPTSGAVDVLGAPPGSTASLARIGALIESPAFYPYLSGRDNLRVLARYSNLSETRADDVLAQVDLADRAGDRFKAYSQGMKQRLGVAAALLKDPDLLILDEPTNGLDPQGMAEMRTLIRRLGQGRRTVLLSSHLLGEVEQICDRVAVLQVGRLVAEGTMADLRGEGALLIRVQPLEQAEQVLRETAGIGAVQNVDGALRVAADPGEAARITALLVQAGLTVSEVRPIQHSLEDVFLDLTQKGDRHDSQL